LDSWDPDDFDEEEQPENVGPERKVGELEYSTGAVSEIRVPVEVGSTFQANLVSQQTVQGIHIPSHRPLYSYQQVQSIPTVPRRKEHLFHEYVGIVRARFYGHHHPRTPNYFIKETLIALATFGYGSAVVERDEESLRLFNEFVRILKIVLPPSLGFKKLSIRIPEVVLVTETGNFSIDAVSGGVASLIDIAWQIFSYAIDQEQFVVTIDEPENHLHPQLQKRVLNSLVEAFPKAQFVVATHNPFIVTSVPESSVYVLRYDQQRRVVSEPLPTRDRSGTANEILRDVLGLETSSPLWVDKELRKVEKWLSDQEWTPETAQQLKARLKRAGLEQHAATVVGSKAKRDKKNDSTDASDA
jgi:hypothetical protein